MTLILMKLAFMEFILRNFNFNSFWWKSFWRNSLRQNSSFSQFLTQQFWAWHSSAPACFHCIFEITESNTRKEKREKKRGDKLSWECHTRRYKLSLDWQLNWQAETCQIISLAVKLRLVSFRAKMIFQNGSKCGKKWGYCTWKFVQMFILRWGHRT